MASKTVEKNIGIFIKNIVAENYHDAHDALRDVIVDKIRERVSDYEKSKKTGSN